MEDIVKQAGSIGYRHIDTAKVYRSEAGVGTRVWNCGILKEEIFITSRVAGKAKLYKTSTKSIDETLAKIGLSYLDMMIIHSPQSRNNWRGKNIMLKIRKFGKSLKMLIRPES